MERVAELHVWGLSTSRLALTAHLLCGSEALPQSASMLKQADQPLQAFGIRKSTLQLDFVSSQHHL